MNRVQVVVKQNVILNQLPRYMQSAPTLNKIKQIQLVHQSHPEFFTETKVKKHSKNPNRNF